MSNIPDSIGNQAHRDRTFTTRVDQLNQVKKVRVSEKRKQLSTNKDQNENQNLR